jgi:hypothetical protein
MRNVRRPTAKTGVADRLFLFGCTAVYLGLVGGVIVALKIAAG